MNKDQLSLWEEDNNRFSKSKKEDTEYLLTKVEPSKRDLLRYSVPLKKSDLHFSAALWNSYVMESNKPQEAKKHYIKPGFEDKVLKTISEYSNKPIEDLLVLDLVILKKSIERIFSGGPLGKTQINRFKKKNELTTFNEKQYEVIDEYIRYKELDLEGRWDDFDDEEDNKPF